MGPRSVVGKVRQVDAGVAVGVGGEGKWGGVRVVRPLPTNRNTTAGSRPEPVKAEKLGPRPKRVPRGHSCLPTPTPPSFLQLLLPLHPPAHTPSEAKRHKAQGTKLTIGCHFPPLAKSKASNAPHTIKPGSGSQGGLPPAPALSCCPCCCPEGSWQG